ncbi:MAG: replicative DNA helicase [Clostridia bacterium]
MAKENLDLKRTPVNYEAEQALLGCILMDNNAANDYVTQLNESDFAMSQNKVIFKAISAVNQENKPVDHFVVLDRLKIDNKLEEAGNSEYILSLMTILPSAANVLQYFEIVKRDSLRRKVIEAGNNMIRNAYTDDSGLSSLDFAERAVFEISKENETSKLSPIIGATTAAYRKVIDMQTGKYPEPGIVTGFAILDRIITSLAPGALTILAARPSVGKTAFALNIAINAGVYNDKSVAIFSLEMPTTQLAQRMLTTLSRVEFNVQKTQGKMDKNDLSTYYHAHEALVNSKIYVDDNSYNTPGDVISKCRRLKKSVGLDLVIIDYLQLMELGKDKKGTRENRQQEVSAMSRLMKIFAKELNVPFLVLSQMSRAIESRDNAEPMLSDLRESGSIEQDADIVMFLHRLKKTENATGKESKLISSYAGNVIKLLVLKNRNGELGDAYFDWKGNLQRYTSIVEADGKLVETDTKGKANIQKATVELEKQPTDDVFSGLSKVMSAESKEVACDKVMRDEDDFGIIETNGNDEKYAEDDIDEVSDGNIPF